jgi:DNA-binding NtrC family response regulator
MIATSALPCDSPAVRNRSIRPSFYPKLLPHPGHRAAILRAISLGRVLAPSGHASIQGGFVELFADRFVLVDARRTIDLATGWDVLLIVTSAGGVSDERRWSVRCDVLQKLRHRSIARLLDYGAIGEHQRFEAWDCGAEWHGAREPAEAAAGRAAQFLDSCGLSVGTTAASSVRHSSSNAAAPTIVPDAAAGYPMPTAAPRREAAIDDCGLELVSRSAVATIAELFEPGSCSLARAIALWGPRGCGITTALAHLSRLARLQGIVPMASVLLASPIATLVEGHTVLVIDRTGADGWRSLVDTVIRSPRPHVLLTVAERESDAIDSVSLASVPVDALAEAVRPAEVSVAISNRVRRAAERSEGLPARFVEYLWGPSKSAAVRTASTRGSLRAAEAPATYGAPPEPVVARVPTEARPWPAPGELAGLRRRAELGAELVDRGRHAPGERVLRQAAASLARRGDWTHASQAALALGRSIARRGRPKDAQLVLSDAREYARRDGNEEALIDVAIRTGHVSIDLARLEDAETTLSVAVAAARAMSDLTRMAEATVALARCLFWRGRFAEAAVLANGINTERLAPAVAIRSTVAASRSAVGTCNLAVAVSLAAGAVQEAMRLQAPAVLARAACAAAFAHLAVGDFDAVERDVILSVAASRATRDPLRALRARLLLAEAARRNGRPSMAAALVGRLRKLAGTALPAVLKARRDLLADLVANSANAETIVSRHAASSGLPALALFGPAPLHRDPWTAAGGMVDETVAILRVCQDAGDEPQVLAEVCKRVRRQLDAASVAIAAGALPQMWTVASDGARIDLATAERAMAATAPIAPHRFQDRIEAAAPVRYGGETIGALVARWTLGTNQCLGRAVPMLTMGATAAAPAVAAARAARMRPTAPALADFVGTGPEGAELRRAVERAAAAPFSVLIEGESGSGKELVARAVHRGSARRDRAMCTLNCAALPDDLVEAELFGHARGAFTGAVGERAGVFEEAHGGTLFLDEIGELSPRAQAKVLRVIQEGELRRVGENTSRRVDVRIVAATNRDLRDEVAAGRFRLDLLYRLDVLRIVVAPLRERREDIPVLVEHFWRESTGRIGSRATLAAAAVAALARYDWPGNVRELQNVLAALAVRSPRRGVVQPAALPPQFGLVKPLDGWRLEDARRTFEQRFVRAALVRSGGRRGQTADELGLTRQGLTKLMARLGID